MCVPNQAPGALERYGVTRAEADAMVWTIDPGGSRLGGAAAVCRALSELGGGWRLLAALYRLPGVRQAGDAVYRWVAGHRETLSDRWGDAPPYP